MVGYLGQQIEAWQSDATWAPRDLLAFNTIRVHILPNDTLSGRIHLVATLAPRTLPSTIARILASTDKLVVGRRQDTLICPLLHRYQGPNEQQHNTTPSP